MSLGVWGQRWIESSLSMKNLDPSLLMWDMRRSVATASFPNRKCTVKFTYPDLTPARNSWWIVVEDGAVDLCSVDPGYEVDLYVRAALRNMIAVWMGISTLESRDRSRQDRTDGRQGPCTFDTQLARPQRVRRRKEPQNESGLVWRPAFRTIARERQELLVQKANTSAGSRALHSAQEAWSEIRPLRARGWHPREHPRDRPNSREQYPGSGVTAGWAGKIDNGSKT